MRNGFKNGHTVMPKLALFSSIFSASCLVASVAYAECSSYGRPVNADYQSNTNGAFCLVDNKRFSGFGQPLWTFAINDRRITLADPSIIKVQDYFYVTGTSTTPAPEQRPWIEPTYDRANFPIYRSRDLMHWEFFNTVFPDQNRLSDTIQLNDGRRFCQLEAPQLVAPPPYFDPILLTFSAVENRSAGFCSDAAARSYHTSAYVASISRASFLAGGYFANNDPQHRPEPHWFTYTPENNVSSSNFRYDGGYSVGHTVAQTGSAEQLGSRPGDAYWSGYRLCHGLMGCSSWLALDTFLFFDPANQQGQLLYTWSDGNFENPDWRGNHIATAPILSPFFPYRMNAAASPRPLAYMKNSTNRIAGVDNGCFGPVGRVDTNNGPFPRCVAEGAAVFIRNGRYYLLFSRNYWDSPGYGVFYRTSSSFDGLALQSWNDLAVPEAPLLVSRDRALPYGASYGHGEVFQHAGRYYLMVHAKDGGAAGMRSVFFKELTFRDDGSIEPLSDAPDAPQFRNIRSYLVPR